jgi:hypothetical protein
MESKEILEQMFKDYLVDEDWKFHEEHGTKSDFINWLKCVKYSWKQVAEQSSWVVLLKQECKYETIFDYLYDLEEITQAHAESLKPKKVEIYNAELFIKYISKFNDEDKVKMLFEVAKFLGEDNLKEMLDQCKALSQHCRIHSLTERLEKLVFNLSPLQSN